MNTPQFYVMVGTRYLAPSAARPKGSRRRARFVDEKAHAALFSDEQADKVVDALGYASARKVPA